MALGSVLTKHLSDIADAIRARNGAQVTYRPGEMAAAVAALDGTATEPGAVMAYKDFERGLLDTSVLSGIADAIRAQNGSADTYTPAEMAAAILGLEWDTGTKTRALLLSDGTLELNHLGRRQANSGGGTIAQAWDVSTDGYASDEERPWHGSRASIRRVWVDPSMAGAGCADISHWFQNMTALEEVVGFGNLAGVTKADQLFSSDPELRSVWGAGFDASGIASATYPFYGCPKLVGGHLTVAKDTFGKSYLKTGSGGLLADPADDERTWVWGHLYEDGGLVVTTSGTAEGGREALASGTLCANARYGGLGSMPWHGQRDSISSVTFAADLAGVSGLCMDYWLYNTRATAIAFSGWGNVHPVSWEFFLNGSLNLATLDLRGLDPSTILRWANALAGMTALATILVDATWALPSSLASKTGTFSGDTALVGGNGTAFDSKSAGADMAVIDAEGTPGYLTAG